MAIPASNSRHWMVTYLLRQPIGFFLSSRNSFVLSGRSGEHRHELLHESTTVDTTRQKFCEKLRRVTLVSTCRKRIRGLPSRTKRVIIWKEYSGLFAVLSDTWGLHRSKSNGCLQDNWVNKVKAHADGFFATKPLVQILHSDLRMRNLVP